MVFRWSVLICLLPQKLEAPCPLLSLVRLQQTSKKIELIVETEDHCEFFMIGKKDRRRPCPRKSNLKALQKIIEIPLEHPTSKKDVFGAFELEHKILILPVLPSSKDQRFKELWQEHQPKYIFVLQFGKYKVDLKKWMLSPWHPQWFLPDHQGRQLPLWRHFHYRSDWPREIRFYKGDIPFPNRAPRAHSRQPLYRR